MFESLMTFSTEHWTLCSILLAFAAAVLTNLALMVSVFINRASLKLLLWSALMLTVYPLLITQVYFSWSHQNAGAIPFVTFGLTGFISFRLLSAFFYKERNSEK